MTTELTTKNAKAVIASEGAELKSLVIGGREIMWCGDPAFWGKTVSYTHLRAHET